MFLWAAAQPTRTIAGEEMRRLDFWLAPPAVRTWVHVCMLSCTVMPDFFQPLWTATPQAPLSMGLFQQEYRNVAISSSRGSSRPRN